MNFRDDPDMEVLIVAWVYLILAGILEIVWAFAMKQSDGFTKLAPTVVTLVAMLASFALLALAMRSLPLGTAYPVWTGIGAVGAFAVGIVLLGEHVNVMRASAAAMILGGLVLMKAS
jgi:quaternary ammonium compound-resistance protein SugE